MMFVFCKDIEFFQFKKEDMIKLRVKSNIFHLELSSEPNVDIIGNTVSMWEKHEF